MFTDKSWKNYSNKCTSSKLNINTFFNQLILLETLFENIEKNYSNYFIAEQGK